MAARVCQPTALGVLWYLVFLGFAVNYMVRININIAIVSMVQQRASAPPENVHVSECFVAEYRNTSVETEVRQVSGLSWDEHQQGMVLGGFFWLHWVWQIPGGIWASRYGTKLVFGLSNWIACLLGFLIPYAANLDYRALIIIRVLQGFVGGLAWPSMHNMAANWIPPNERSNFVTAYLGSSVGAGLTYPLCGLLIDWFGWPSVFYATGIIGTLWFTAWWFLVFDSPAQHPRISDAEKEYIETKLTNVNHKNKPPIPWKAILVSRAVWMNILAQWGNIWGLFTLMTQAPTYFKHIHGWNIRMTGILSGLPHICRVALAYVVAKIGDHLLEKNVLSRTVVRRLATAICCIGQGVFILGLAFSGCNYMAAIVCLTAATAASGAVSTGQLAGIIDISPNFASIILGLTNMITVTPGFISPVIVGALTYQNQTVGQWQLVFIIASIKLLFFGTLYCLFSTTDLQEWNNPVLEMEELKKSKDVEENKELQAPLIIEKPDCSKQI